MDACGDIRGDCDRRYAHCGRAALWGECDQPTLATGASCRCDGDRTASKVDLAIGHGSKGGICIGIARRGLQEDIPAVADRSAGDDAHDVDAAASRDELHIAAIGAGRGDRAANGQVAAGFGVEWGDRCGGAGEGDAAAEIDVGIGSAQCEWIAARDCAGNGECRCTAVDEGDGVVECNSSVIGHEGADCCGVDILIGANLNGCCNGAERCERCGAADALGEVDRTRREGERLRAIDRVIEGHRPTACSESDRCAKGNGAIEGHIAIGCGDIGIEIYCAATHLGKGVGRCDCRGNCKDSCMCESGCAATRDAAIDRDGYAVKRECASRGGE